MISNDKKVMAKIARRLGSCPYCGGNNFIVSHTISDVYYTNEFGDILDVNNIRDEAKGICTRCKRVLNFLPTPCSFLPLSELGSLILDVNNVSAINICYNDSTPNPMLLKDGE